MSDKKTPAEKRAETIKFRNEMSAKFEALREPKSKKQHLDEAQMIMYDAWESSPARALKLAHMALEHSADCADAYLLLADLEARTTRDQIELIDQAIKAGGRALGKRSFQEHAGISGWCWRPDRSCGPWRPWRRFAGSTGKGMQP